MQVFLKMDWTEIIEPLIYYGNFIYICVIKYAPLALHYTKHCNVTYLIINFKHVIMSVLNYITLIFYMQFELVMKKRWT
jgi:hypothetical protein